MVARIIAVTNQKGGSGKTTLSMQLAGSLAKRKQKVLVVDADPQGSSTRWSASAPEDSIFPADVVGLSNTGAKLHQEIKKFIDKYDWILVDCPPAIESAAPQSALLIADLALVPIIPSPPDLWAGVGIRELISRAHVINEGLQARVVPNMCQPNTKLSKEVLSILSEFEIPLTKSCLHHRTAFRKSAAIGGTVFDLGAEAALASAEVLSLTKEIINIVSKKTKTTSSGAAAQVGA